MPTLTGTVRAAGSATAIVGARVRAHPTVLRLDKPLRAFATPSTAGAAVATLAAGSYPVTEVRTGAASDADHVEVVTPAAPADRAWLCSRWRRTTYALLADGDATAETVSDASGYRLDVAGTLLHRVRTSRPGHVDGESARGLPGTALPVELRAVGATVPESRLVGLLHHFAGWYYTPVKERTTVGGVTRSVRYVPQYPYSIGVSVRLDPGHPEPPIYNDCCSFVEALVVKAWLDEGVQGFSWDLAKHRRAMLVDPDERYSPVEVLEDTGVADHVDDDELPPPWTVIQGWGATGHTFLIVDAHAATGRVLTLESNLSFWLNGPGFRMLAPLNRFLGTCWRCPTDGFLYDPARGDPDRGIAPGTRFRATTRWQLEHGRQLPTDWTCPSCDTPKDDFVPHCQPPRDWWHSTWLPTWADVKLRYPRRRLARLRLHDLHWVR